MWKWIGKAFVGIGHGALQAAKWSSDHPEVVAAIEAAASAAVPAAAPVIAVVHGVAQSVKETK